MKDFVEYQSIVDQKSVKWIFRISFVIYFIGIIVGWFKERALSEAFLVILIGTAILYFIFLNMKMKTVITSKHLEINHPFIGRYLIPISKIELIDLITDANLPNNRRTFHSKLGTLYRMFGNEGLLIYTQSGTKFFLGSQRVELLNEKLSQCRKQFTIGLV